MSPASLRFVQSVATLVGARDSLQAINTSQLSDRAVVYVAQTESFYVLRRSSTVAANGSTVVAPAQGGPGRWFIFEPGTINTVVTGATVPLSASQNLQVDLGIPSPPAEPGAPIQASFLSPSPTGERAVVTSAEVDSSGHVLVNVLNTLASPSTVPYPVLYTLSYQPRVTA